MTKAPHTMVRTKTATCAADRSSARPEMAHARTRIPVMTSTRFQNRSWRVEMKSWESTGRTRAKSSSPSRTSYMNVNMLGRTKVARIPPSRMCTPSTASSSDSLHPRRSLVNPNTSWIATRPVTSLTPDSINWRKKLSRYWTSYWAPRRQWTRVTAREWARCLMSPPP